MATRARPVKAPAWITLDSSCWIEYLRDSLRADLFASAVEDPAHLIVPVTTIYEVTKKLRRELDASVAAYAESVMCRGTVISVDIALSRAATHHPLPLTDSLVYTTAQLHGATLWTPDSHFKGLPGVKFFDSGRAGAA